MHAFAKLPALRGIGPSLHGHRHEAGRYCRCAAKTLTARLLKSGAPPTKESSSTGRRPTTASKTGRTVPAALAWMLEAQINLNGEDFELLLPTPIGPALARAHFLPRHLETGPRGVGHQHSPPRVPPQLRDPPPRRRRQRRRLGRHRLPPCHRVETMLARYTHAVGGNFGAIGRRLDDAYSRLRKRTFHVRDWIAR